VTEHLTDRQIELYHSRTITAAELAALDKHASTCAECRTRLASAGGEEEKFLSLKQALDSEAYEHLSYEQLAAYVDGTLTADETEALKEHLRTCSECQLMSSDLMVFKEEVAQDLEKVFAPPAGGRASASLWQRLKTTLGSAFTFRSPVLAMSFGALALLSIGIVFWFVARSLQSRDARPQVAQNPTPTPAVSPSQSDAAEGNNSSQAPTPVPESAQPVLLALNDGARRVGLDEQGNVTGLDELSPAQRQAVKNALTTQQAANASALAGLSGRRAGLRGDGSKTTAFGPSSPVGKVILTDKPALSWSRLEGAEQYRVIIYDANFNAVASSPELQANTWTVPRALGRGQIYSWQVVATKGGQEIKAPVPPEAEARFKVLEQSKASEISQARKAAATSHLALGVLYAQAGLLDEAEREFNLLLKENPNSTIARNLLRNLRAARRSR
jgi:hypothetical protein